MADVPTAINMTGAAQGSSAGAYNRLAAAVFAAASLLTPAYTGNYGSAASFSGAASAAIKAPVSAEFAAAGDGQCTLNPSAEMVGQLSSIGAASFIPNAPKLSSLPVTFIGVGSLASSGSDNSANGVSFVGDGVFTPEAQIGVRATLVGASAAQLSAGVGYSNRPPFVGSGAATFSAMVVRSQSSIVPLFVGAGSAQVTGVVNATVSFVGAGNILITASGSSAGVSSAGSLKVSGGGDGFSSSATIS